MIIHFITVVTLLKSIYTDDSNLADIGKNSFHISSKHVKKIEEQAYINTFLSFSAM